MTTPLEEILEEVANATRKHPRWPTDPLHALAIIGEEFGELTKDVLQLTYEPTKTSKLNARMEAIQTAASAIRFVLSLNEYQYKPGEQHRQRDINELPAFDTLPDDYETGDY